LLYLLLASTRTSSVEIITDLISILALGILLVFPIENTYPFITGWYGRISFDDVVADLISILEFDILLILLTRKNR